MNVDFNVWRSKEQKKKCCTKLIGAISVHISLMWFVRKKRQHYKMRTKCLFCTALSVFARSKARVQKDHTNSRSLDNVYAIILAALVFTIHHSSETWNKR